MGRIFRFMKDWMLVIAMAAGAALYLVYMEADFLHPYGAACLASIKFIQPVLLFTMLFLSFSKIEPKDLKPHKWQGLLLILQGVLYVLPLLLVSLLKRMGAWYGLEISLEAFALCMICPTATACSVMTAKLGGDRAGVMTYTIFINLLTAVIVPVMVPLNHPVAGLEFGSAFFLILGKVFPMLILPCLLAWFVRYAMPSLHRRIASYSELAFVIWAVSLTLAILMSVRAIVHSSCGAAVLGGIALASLASCAFQFHTGKKIGERYGARITAGQSMGQKNTVFAIWMAYTFMDPLTSVAGGFYSLWHNAFNSWQLYRKRNGKSF